MTNPLHRRDFLTTAGIAAAAWATAAHAQTLPSATAPTTAPADLAPTTRPTPQPGRMKVGCQRWGSDPGKLPFLIRHGVEMICISPAPAGPDGIWTADTCAAARKRVEDTGLIAGSMYWGVPIDVLIPERRNQAIERCKKQIAAAGKGGIPCLAYNLHVRVWGARTGKVTGRGGAQYSAWDLRKVQPQKKPSTGPISEDEHWARIEHFLKEVVPVAHESKVKLACHPNDPPMPKDNAFGIAQVLDTVDGLKKFVTTQDSPYHGLTFCQGTICEMLQNPATEIFDIIRWFGTRKKIHQVHFRNIIGGLNQFAETYVDNGVVNMAKAARTYKEVGYEGMLMPDHVPSLPKEATPENTEEDGLAPWAFSYGYIKGLIDAVEA